ncbi:pimeloyl-ACP methyl ester carboxylesterase [Streptomyces sp. 1114.5]|uniref:alpha/beta fold hydrolase n=1 Tax=unclassified Streptomyces TaxID=2593676 RepID=UPI000BDA7AE5|nr:MULTISPECIES: alpha/beta hydrolase [unclassified Streptomyces]RKT17075.1 pimeloyl-ACP methyl ester carboxylesterase [Streptomyces sp. 1114.5]SOB83286.1 Pimeloyl-ACP methyl ester carboxylesterase [Streptomyces sp. 1331.2]
MFAVMDEIAVPGTTLRGYAAGDPDHPAVVIASACGMPVGLTEAWIRALAPDHRVVTWETRGMFGTPADQAGFDALGHDVAAQAADLLAVMDHYGIERAHVMGLCGGAVVAVRAAEAQPRRFDSLSLWHGDFSGTPGPVTDHQENLRALLGMAAQGREDAAMINGALAETARAGVPADVADLVVYPYSTDELFYRYSVLTLPTMTEDCTPALAGIRPPVLVVTSEDDHTAHPDGSHRVAAGLPDSRLHVEPHGDHISVFGAGPRLRRLLTDFLSGTPSTPEA